MSVTISHGAHPNLDRTAYEAIPAINNTVLKIIKARSALHAQYELLHPKESTAAMDNSNAVHTALLEPAMFHARYIRAPTKNGKPLARRSNADKAEWADFEDAHKGHGILTPDMWDACLQISASIWEGDRADQSLARSILGGSGHNELTMVWSDRGTGEECKCRPDRVVDVAGKRLIVDVKAVVDAEESAFMRAAANYGWHQQAAFYLDGANVLAPGHQRTWLWIAVEKTPPYAMAFYEPDPESLEQGRNDYEVALRAYREARTTNRWPGYPAEIKVSRLPKWAIRADEWEVV